MLDADACFEKTQNERKGRFLIQELEDENLALKICKSSNIKKKPKHSSITDSIIIHHTEILDSNSRNGFFKTFITDENIEGWLDFESLWQQFSTRHSKGNEDLEKIFHYIESHHDHESDISINRCTLTTNESFQKGGSQEKLTRNLTSVNEITKTTNDESFKRERGEKMCKSKNEDCSAELNNQSHLKYLESKIKESTPISKSTKNCVKKKNSLVLTNIYDAPYIVSPAFSPIAENCRQISFDNEKLQQLNQQLNQSKKWKNYIVNSEKTRKTRLFSECDYTYSSSHLQKVPNCLMKIDQQVSFTINNSKNNKNDLEKNVSQNQFQISSNKMEILTSINNIEANLRCCVCKNKV
jgi:hypothetical protein